MERAQAIALLGLDAEFSEGDVKSSYRRAAKDDHTETGQIPNAERLTELGEARDLLLGTGAGTALVSREDLAVVLRQQGELTRISRESDATVSRVVMHHVGKLAAARSRRLTVSGLGAVTGILMTLVGALTRIGLGSQTQTSLVLAGGALAFLSLATGAVGLLSKDREARLQLEIEEAGETLVDRGALVGTLAELGLTGFFTRDQLQEEIHYWSEGDNEVEVIRFRDRVPLSRVAAKIGPVDFARLLIAKGLESGLLAYAEERDEDAVRQHGYRVAR